MKRKIKSFIAEKSFKFFVGTFIAFMAVWCSYLEMRVDYRFYKQKSNKCDSLTEQVREDSFRLLLLEGQIEMWQNKYYQISNKGLLN